MRDTEKMDYSADGTEQFLPPENISAGLTRGEFASARRVEAGVENLNALSHASAVSAPKHEAPVVEMAGLAAGTVAGARAAAETLQLISDHAMRLRQLNAETLSVVLRPDAQTELLLELRMRGERIDARAELHRGDFGALNSQWTDLQDKLGHHGVRLGTLMREGSFLWNGSQGEGHSRSDAAPHEDEEHQVLPARAQSADGQPRSSFLPRVTTRGLEAYA